MLLCCCAAPCCPSGTPSSIRSIRGHPQLLHAGKLLAERPRRPVPLARRTQDCNLESSQFFDPAQHHHPYKTHLQHLGSHPPPTTHHPLPRTPSPTQETHLPTHHVIAQAALDWEIDLAGQRRFRQEKYPKPPSLARNPLPARQTRNTANPFIRPSRRVPVSCLNPQRRLPSSYTRCASCLSPVYGSSPSPEWLSPIRQEPQSTRPPKMFII